MARIAGVELPRGKRVDIALTYIYGIGRTTALEICDNAGISWERNIDDLNADEVNEIRKELESSIRLKVISVVTSAPTSSVSWTLAATEDCAIAAVFLSTASVPTLTPAPARVRVTAWLPRRSSLRTASFMMFRYSKFRPNF